MNFTCCFKKLSKHPLSNKIVNLLLTIYFQLPKGCRNVCSDPELLWRGGSEIHTLTRERSPENVSTKETSWSQTTGNFWKINTLINARVLLKLAEDAVEGFLPAATKLWPPSYVFTRVCDSVHREGGLQAGRTPPPQTRQSPPPGQADPPPPGKQTPEYGLRAAGTHPTGMHSCLNL